MNEHRLIEAKTQLIISIDYLLGAYEIVKKSLKEDLNKEDLSDAISKIESVEHRLHKAYNRLTEIVEQ